jgi:hypothetical protein
LIEERASSFDQWFFTNYVRRLGDWLLIADLDLDFLVQGAIWRVGAEGHPHIVKVLTSGVLPGVQPYYTMEGGLPPGIGADRRMMYDTALCVCQAPIDV